MSPLDDTGESSKKYLGRFLFFAAKVRSSVEKKGITSFVPKIGVTTVAVLTVRHVQVQAESASEISPPLNLRAALKMESTDAGSPELIRFNPNSGEAIYSDKISTTFPVLLPWGNADVGRIKK
jgi:hypothetical protein